LPHRPPRGGGGADRIFGWRGGGGLRGHRRTGGYWRQGPHRIAGGAGIRLRRPDFQDCALRTNRLGNACASVEGTSGAARQLGAASGNAPPVCRFEAPRGAPGREGKVVFVGQASRPARVLKDPLLVFRWSETAAPVPRALECAPGLRARYPLPGAPGSVSPAARWTGPPAPGPLSESSLLR